MKKFFERHCLSKLTQEEIENLKSPICIKKIELISENFQTHAHTHTHMNIQPQPRQLYWCSLFKFKKEIIPIFHRLIQKRKERKTFHKQSLGSGLLFYQNQTMVITKKRNLKTNITHRHERKNLYNTLANRIHHIKLYYAH